MGDFIPTRGSSKKSSVQEDFICMDYKHAWKERNNIPFKQNTTCDSIDPKQIKESKQKNVKKQQELEMKAARYDVIKYGMSGFEKTKIKAVKIDTAISLGAKPPKNEMINYKHLKSMRKNTEEETEDQKSLGFKNSILKNIKKVHKKSPMKILSTYGTINSNKLVKVKSS